MDDAIEQKRDVMPLAWVPKGGEKRAAKGAGRVRGSQEAPAGGSEKGRKKTLDEAAMTPFLREITLVSSGGAFLDGYVLSLIGVALTQITAQMSLTTHWTAAIGASVLLGILVGSIAGGYLTDIIGRKKMFVLDIIAIALFSALSMTDATPMQLVIYRFFIGVFVGADYPIATSLITEFTPKHHRAISMGMVSAAWYLGATVAALVGYCLCDVDNGWKLMLGSAIIPCVFLLIGRCKVPESPLWLKSKGREEEALKVVLRVYGADVTLEGEEEAPKTKAGFAEVFSKGYAARIVFLGILTLCQVVPMYAIYTFGPQIMTAFGLGVGKSAILGESVLSLFFLVGSLPAMFWLNSMGRRPLLIRSLFLMAVGLVVLGLFPTAPLPVIICAFGLYAFFSGGAGHPAVALPQRVVPHRGQGNGRGFGHRHLARRHDRGDVRHADLHGRVRHRAHHAGCRRPGDLGIGAVDLHGARDRRQIARRNELAVGREPRARKACDESAGARKGTRARRRATCGVRPRLRSPREGNPPAGFLRFGRMRDPPSPPACSGRGPLVTFYLQPA